MMRLMAIIIIVFFHSFQMMYGSSHFPNSYMIYENLYYTFNQCIIIHIGMPTFVFISGFLFMYSHLNKHQSFKELLQAKIKRLILPYFVFAFLLTVGTPGFSWEGLLSGGYTHLWFLPMLFWCFICAYLLVHYLKFEKYAPIYTLFFLCLLLLPETMNIQSLKHLRLFGLQGVYNWFGWFSFGMIVFQYSQEIYAFLSKNKIIIILLAFIYITCISLFPPIPYGKTLSWYTITETVCMILIIWFFFKNISWQKLKFYKYLANVSKCSFGIYIFHMPIVIYSVSSTSQRIFGLTYLADNYQYVFPFLYASGAFILSFIVSYLISKTNIGKYLLG